MAGFGRATRGYWARASAKPISRPTRDGTAHALEHPAATLASAACCHVVAATSLGDVESGEDFGSSGVDSDEVIEILFLGAELHANAKALDYLASIPAKDVHANNLLLLRDPADDLCDDKNGISTQIVTFRPRILYAWQCPC